MTRTWLTAGMGLVCINLLACSGADSDATATTAAASASTATNGEWVQPMTPWGEPDISGTWPIYHLIGTPLIRPPQFGERRTMNDEEFANEVESAEARNSRYEEEIENNQMGGGHWAEATEALRLTSLIVDPPDGQLPALTEQGQALSAAERSGWVTGQSFDAVSDFDSWERCITRGLPVSMLPRNYNNGISILQTRGMVAITLEMAHETRLIPTDGRPPLDPAIRQWLGESRGHWEGNTLVVETTNFNGRTHMTNPGVPGSNSPYKPIATTPQMHITERFTRTGPDTMDYELTVDEPVVMTRPWTVRYPMRRDESYRAFEYACHEDNTAVRNYIETSRYERGLTGE